MSSNSNEPQLIAGIDSSGNLVPVKVESDGSLGISGGGGAGGDATATKQDEQTQELQQIKAISNPPSNVNGATILAISTNIAIIAANTNRKGLTIFNPLAFSIFLAFGNTVSTSQYAVEISQDFRYYEVPYGYTGAISLISAGGTGDIYTYQLI